MPVTDAEIRGRLLSIYYERRHNNDGWVPTTDGDLSGGEPISSQVIANVCLQLADAGLIQWKALKGVDEGIIIGRAKITGMGVDAVEKSASPNLNIVFPVKTSIIKPRSREQPASFIPDTSTWEVAAQIAADRPKLNATVASTSGTVEPPLAPNSLGVTAGIEAAATITRAVVPTIYPEQPSGMIIVQNQIMINFHNAEFRDFSAKMDELVAHIRESNEISREVGDKLVAELTAGMTILKSPKPEKTMIEFLLKRPLMYLADKAASTIISSLAAILLAKLMGFL